MKNLKTISAVLIALTMMLAMSVSHATTYTFDKITSNNSVDLTGQLFLDINGSNSSSDVTFTFRNEVGKDSSLHAVFFDLGLGKNDSLASDTIFSGVSVSADSDGASTDAVHFEKDTGPNVLPGANGNPLKFVSNYISGSPTPQQGLDEGGEWVTFLATLGSGFSYNNLIDGFMSGAYRVGVHVQSIGDACGGLGSIKDSNGDETCSDSSSYMVNPNVVPVPAAAWLFGTALFGFFATTRRKKIS